MRVKRYIVDSMPDAMVKIRKDLGSDAVILSNKKVKVGGFLGMFGQVKLEVIAAVESLETDHPGSTAIKSTPQPVPASGKPSSPASNHPAVAALLAQSAAARTAPGERNGQQAPDRPVLAGRRSVPQAYRRTTELLSGLNEEVKAVQPSADRQNLEETKAAELSRALKSAFESASAGEAVPQASDEAMDKPMVPSIRGSERQRPAEGAEPPYSESLKEDIRQMRSMISELARQQRNERTLPDPLQTLLEQFKQQDVDSRLAESWIEPAYEKWKKSGETLGDQELVQAVRSELEHFLDGRISEEIAENTRMVYVAGPTGVGKTTTIAKMAADQIFRKHKKVGFITADTYRISAVEQLRTYASILNVPLEVVQSPGDMKRAVSRLEECDLVFVDTAGRNYLNELYVAELHSLLTLREQSETCLVLSLTSKSSDMRLITEHFSKYGLDKVIFTKLDETESFGSMFNLLFEYPLQLMFLTNGQTVPDDLISANSELLVNELLGVAPS
ncbi:flagellar biosynthesis protein FlhF [Paenibacillus caui]|uniref:flagellar biosynthesis protein FlhF n=1 Tax=Paenibacillus caui TaxID=2873927 RepID=UPI001CA97C77|nr:flagellar biosynthesis protein FlhF [Paenibacillus caui]